MGFIGDSGKIIIDLRFDKVENFKNGIAKVKMRGLWGYIDKNGTEFWED